MSKTVYQLIAEVAAEAAKAGIAKGKKNQQQGYQFRGIDDVYNALAPLLAKAGLVILPRCMTREVTERQTRNGGALFNVVVEVEFDFVSSHDGSKHTVVMYGEAMDSADKATNKAMSAAYKYAAMQAFCIPTEGDNDADATTHEVAAKPKVNEQFARVFDGASALLNGSPSVDQINRAYVAVAGLLGQGQDEKVSVLQRQIGIKAKQLGYEVDKERKCFVDAIGAIELGGSDFPGDQ
jgi:hypothetical protein